VAGRACGAGCGWDDKKDTFAEEVPRQHSAPRLRTACNPATLQPKPATPPSCHPEPATLQPCNPVPLLPCSPNPAARCICTLQPGACAPRLQVLAAFAPLLEPPQQLVERMAPCGAPPALGDGLLALPTLVHRG